MNKISDLVTRFRSDQTFLVNYYQQLLTKIKALQHLNFFTEIYPEEVLAKVKDPAFFKRFKDGQLFGVPFFLKDNFMIKGKKASGGTKILKNFVPSYSATAYQLVLDQGAVLVGKTILDELGMGGTGLEAAEGLVINPFDKERVAGGSSSGSMVAVAKQLCSFSIGSDTGDSCRLPASYLGIFGFKPTFGLISRYGLIPYSPSLDTVGLMASNVKDLRPLCQVLFKPDPKDLACQKTPLPTTTPAFSPQKIKVLAVGLDEKLVNPVWIKEWKEKVLNKLVAKNVTLEIRQLPTEITSNLTFLYQLTSFPEGLSSQANLTGVNFGFNQANRDQDAFFEFIKKNRGQSFGPELKRRYVLASLFIDSQHQHDTYFQGRKMRTYVNNYFAQLFQEFDFIIHIASPDIAPKISELQNYKKKRIPIPNVTILLLLANFGGFPSLVFPFAKKQNLSIGFNIFANVNNDFKLLDFAEFINDEIIN